eukprot:TRINITY_DN3797_c0_g2_i1.p1 TRINITY_DN3797_c0_g2~~TRINITY_DN3797_c0_g2_i1.p1  ORF type:complete len:285 (+),score=39.26 TRINITY_DN3797_c0_g2_i1:103-957(+)
MSDGVCVLLRLRSCAKHFLTMFFLGFSVAHAVRGRDWRDDFHGRLPASALAQAAFQKDKEFEGFVGPTTGVPGAWMVLDGDAKYRKMDYDNENRIGMEEYMAAFEAGARDLHKQLRHIDAYFQTSETNDTKRVKVTVRGMSKRGTSVGKDKTVVLDAQAAEPHGAVTYWVDKQHGKGWLLIHLKQILKDWMDASIYAKTHVIPDSSLISALPWALSTPSELVTVMTKRIKNGEPVRLRFKAKESTEPNPPAPYGSWLYEPTAKEKALERPPVPLPSHPIRVQNH